MGFKLSAGLRIGAVLALVFAVATGPREAAADETAAFHQAVASAAGHFREAAFYARRGNATAAAFELEGLIEKWQNVEKAYGEKPPAVYAKDSQWRQTLAKVGERARASLALIDDDKTKQARDMVLPIRKLLSEMRKRNGVTTFSDCIDQANAAFKRLFHFRRQPPNFDDSSQVADLKVRLASTLDAYKVCSNAAPPQIAGDPQFQRLMKDSIYYLERMWVAIKEKNQLNVVNILRRVVSSDEILWLRFG